MRHLINNIFGADGYGITFQPAAASANRNFIRCSNSSATVGTGVRQPDIEIPGLSGSSVHTHTVLPEEKKINLRKALSLIQGSPCPAAARVQDHCQNLTLAGNFPYKADDIQTTERLDDVSAALLHQDDTDEPLVCTVYKSYSQVINRAIDEIDKDSLTEINKKKKKICTLTPEQAQTIENTEIQKALNAIEWQGISELVRVIINDPILSNLYNKGRFSKPLFAAYNGVNYSQLYHRLKYEKKISLTPAKRRAIENTELQKALGFKQDKNAYELAKLIINDRILSELYTTEKFNKHDFAQYNRVKYYSFNSYLSIKSEKALILEKKRCIEKSEIQKALNLKKWKGAAGLAKLIANDSCLNKIYKKGGFCKYAFARYNGVRYSYFLNQLKLENQRSLSSRRRKALEKTQLQKALNSKCWKSTQELARLMVKEPRLLKLYETESFSKTDFSLYNEISIQAFRKFLFFEKNSILTLEQKQAIQDTEIQKTLNSKKWNGVKELVGLITTTPTIWELYRKEKFAKIHFIVYNGMKYDLFMSAMVRKLRHLAKLRNF